MITLRNILAIGAHPDDIELGCGGSVSSFAGRGVHVRALVLTKGEAGNRFETDRVKETRKALKLLGVTDVHTMDFPDTRLHEHLSELISKVEAHATELRPDRVYTMFEYDRHQDHRAAFQASIVACRSALQVLCYETPSSWTNFQPQVFECIDGALEKKIDALTLHESQHDRPYTQPAAMRIHAQFRGQQIGVTAAEAFIGYKVVL
jgi:LmbE family N-acetylglucosaminyl deacetylase